MCLLLFGKQSSGSTDIEDSQLQMSPVFPLTGCRAEVHVSRLNLDLVETCKSSGFVLCSQDSLISTQKSAQPRSPVFPQSNPIFCPKSPVFPGDDMGRERQLEQSPTFVKSPVFARTADCSNHPACENLELSFSSQESSNPTVRSDSPQSPVYHKTPSGQSSLCKDPCRGQVERRDERLTSPTEVQRTDLQLQASDCDQSPSGCRKVTLQSHPLSRREDVHRASPQRGEPSDRQTVHYYWGVPFCPRGLDPDTYTKVDLINLDLCHSGCFLFIRRGLRLRGSKRSEAADFLPEEEEERKDDGEEEQQEKEEGGNKESDEVQMDTDDCEVCPGQTAQRVKKVKSRKDREVEKMEDRSLQRSECPELEAAVVPHSPEASVDCPLCQGSFPASEIEMHAAYCDGFQGNAEGTLTNFTISFLYRYNFFSSETNFYCFLRCWTVRIQTPT
uniref:UBZ4-type domain-containing protein n=1 Tax=Poecilia latipinna TaxID=48699 RepID=A0A3B3VSZ4_9TELE